MAGSNRRYAVAAVILPLLFLVMSGLARASDIFVAYRPEESAPARYARCQYAITAPQYTNAHGRVPREMESTGCSSTSPARSRLTSRWKLPAVT